MLGMDLATRLDALNAAISDLQTGYDTYSQADLIVTDLETRVAAIDEAPAVPGDFDTRVADLEARLSALEDRAEAVQISAVEVTLTHE